MQQELRTATEAKNEVSRNTERSETSWKPISEAHGFAVAEDQFSPIDLPVFDQSAMDGYAFKFADWNAGASLKIVSEIRAGIKSEREIGTGEAARIFTGAAIPAGADTVIMQEKTSVQAGELKILDSSFSIGTNVRKAAAEFHRNQLLCKKGSSLKAGRIGLLAAAGIDKIKVHEFPKTGIIVTGDELTKPGEKLIPGRIYESNSIMLDAALRAMGIPPAFLKSAPDHEEELSAAINSGIQSSDILIITGGVSVGKFDFVKKIVESLGVKTIFHGVLQKPGKPLYFGKIANKLVFGLPGNPVSALTCFYEYVYPAVRQSAGFTDASLPQTVCALESELRKPKNLAVFLRAARKNNLVSIFPNQESHMLSSYAFSDSLVYVPEGIDFLKKGSEVDVHILPA